MAAVSAQHLADIAKFLQTPLGKISTKEELISRSHGDKTVSGVFNIIFSLLSESKSSLGPKNILEEAQVRQWLEYAIVYVLNASSDQNIQTLLKDFNGILRTKTFLVEDRITIADVFLYYTISYIMENLANADKEKYLNVSRWFDNLQQNVSLRQSRKLVDFNINFLYLTNPSRH
ncbi:eukaryotic translation elongation factor 1 epsilon-1 isoform X1 [Cylas formicarius]|uniref:eukaryotic translation elongation factor 1 epsilon-1 isoform X1 n=1 Tax=Cylas formicarius TaxID=197179 RepID=UPI0029584D95|nr:eukaryotic translation elongation factor 1 epsilon-1 isoform X1 [Cylas formicarius]